MESKSINPFFKFFLLNYRSPAIDDFIRMLRKDKIGFQVDQAVSTITSPPFLVEYN